jgi:uncharacterized protein (DUF433 family)
MATMVPDAGDAHVLGLEMFHSAPTMAGVESEGLILGSQGFPPSFGAIAEPVSEAEGLGLLALSRADFATAMRDLRRELAPTGRLETLLVDQITLSASRLRASAEAERRGVPDSSWSRLAEVAGRSMTDAVEQLRALRATPARPAPPASRPIPMPRWDEVEEEEIDEPEAAAIPDYSWTARLEFDGSAGDGTPFVRGTRISAGQVVSMVVDGRTWSQILDLHPEINEADIRACLDFMLDHDGPISLS